MTVRPLPGCEPRAEVQQTIDEKLFEPTLQQMKFGDRVRFRREVLEDLIAKYPREVEPHRRLLKSTLNDDTANYPALAEHYRKQAELHPGDPLALYLAGLALANRDTPQSIRFLEQARAAAPDFAWPALELGQLYSPGTKRADKKKAADEIAAFFGACPSSVDAEAQELLSRAGAPELQARVATALRARLAAETDPRRLEFYRRLWGLEFRTHAPQQHDALRRQIAADLKRLEALNPSPDAAWLVFLSDGYKQSGASPETVAAMEDRVLEAFPHSEEAYRIVRARWEKLHPEPDDGANAAAWGRYHKEYKEALKGWIARFTQSRELQHAEWFYAIQWDPDVSADEGLRTLDDYVTETADYDAPQIGRCLRAAGFLIEHQWQPGRVLGLLRDWDKLMDGWDARVLGDNLSAELEDVWRSNDVILRQAAVGDLLLAARMAKRPEAAQDLRALVERELPVKAWPIIETGYWQNRARLATLDQRNADALTFYQRALSARKTPPQAFEGRVIDDLTDEARALWKQLGGSEAIWNLWSKPPATRVQETAAVGWKKPDKDMPAFELTDLSGRTWRLRDLAGRVVLINVWATWCGPCQAELPHLEKLYEKLKGRTDLQILTFTIDEDLGAVAPFMKDKGFTFPVLPAFSFVTGLLDAVGIPQNWIIDTKGVWRWTGSPDVPDAEWEDAMLRQLESAK